MPPERALARQIFKQLIEIPTTEADKATPKAAQAMAARAVINCRILPGEPIASAEATLRRLAGNKVTVKLISKPTASPPSPVSAALLSKFERLVAAEWPGLPLTPVLEAGATDGAYTRLAGIPTYAPAALPEDPDDVRAHGKDERVGVEAFYQATEFWYRMIKSFGVE